MWVAECARRMAARCAASTRAVTVAPARISPGRRCPTCSTRSPSFCVSATRNWKPCPTISPDVTDLAAGLAVEGSLVQHDRDRLRVSHFIDPIAQLVLRDDALDFRWRGFRFVAQEPREMDRFLECLDRPRLEQLDLLLPRIESMLDHGLAETFRIERVVAFGGQRLDQFRRDAVRRIEFRRVVAIDQDASLLGHGGEDPLDRAKPSSMVAKKDCSSCWMTCATRSTVSCSSGYGWAIISTTTGTSRYRNGSSTPS